MSKAIEAKETMEHFLGQFDLKDEKTKIILDLLFKVIYDIEDNLQELRNEQDVSLSTIEQKISSD